MAAEEPCHLLPFYRCPRVAAGWPGVEEEEEEGAGTGPEGGCCRLVVQVWGGDFGWCRWLLGAAGVACSCHRPAWGSPGARSLWGAVAGAGRSHAQGQCRDAIAR